MLYFCNVNGKLFILTIILLITATFNGYSQQKNQQSGKVYLTPMTIYEGDTIPYVKLPTVYIFKPLKFKNKRARTQYYKLIRDVKKVLPIAKEVNQIVIETYEYLQTLPPKERSKHLKRVEKSLKEQYMPRMKKLTFSHSTGYELVKAFLGTFRAGFYQTFAALFGASLKKEYDATGDDALTERVILLVESGQL